MSDEIIRSLGRIEGQLTGIQSTQAAQNKKLDVVTERLNKVEVKAATNGLISGGVMSVGIALILAGLKQLTPGGS